MISRLLHCVFLGFACALLAGCGGFPVSPEGNAILVPSPNHNARRPNFVIIHDTGAHGSAMGFNYNGKLWCAELLLKEDHTVELIRRAQTLDDYFATLKYPGSLMK